MKHSIRLGKSLRTVHASVPVSHVQIESPSVQPTPEATHVNSQGDTDEKRFGALVEAMQKLGAACQAQKTEWQRELVQGTVELATQIVEQMLEEPAVLECLSMSRIVEKLVAKLEGDGAVNIALHPEDKSMLASSVNEGWQLPDDIRLVESQELKRGECLVESNASAWFYSPKQHVAEIRDLIRLEVADVA